MTYNAGGIWTATVEDCTGAFLKDYRYIVMRDGVIDRCEWDHHSRSIVPQACQAAMTDRADADQKASADETKNEAGADSKASAEANAGKKSDSAAKAEAPATDDVSAAESRELVFRDSWIDAPAGSNGFPRRLSAPEFEKKGFRGAGTAVPVFSLRSEDGFGVGEFLDLKKLIDWAAATGQNIIQLLPINDTTMTGSWQDSYPYNANSTFALHPQFINLQAAGVKLTPALKKKQAQLNALGAIDYELVNKTKTEILHKLYRETGEDTKKTNVYKKFFTANRSWLLPYAVFCALRDEHGTADFTQWGGMASYSATKARKYYQEHADEVDFHCFVQFHLESQLKEVRDYARSRNVYLKGDLPIGISRTSADAWCFPRLFNMDSQAGAPPDFFSADGQNWGFPTYNWEAMAKDNYGWWKARLRKMSEYFDAFRIDHILGFFRIWEIPVGVSSGKFGHFSPSLPFSGEEIAAKGLPLEGLFVQDPHRAGFWHPMISAHSTPEFKALDEAQRHMFDGLYFDFFFHRHNEFWKREAMKKLPELLGSTGMLACGEDLGMIPASVPEVMDKEKILSLEVQRMPKTFGEGFTRPEKYPYLSVCTTSSHDITPLRAWWREDRELTCRYFREMLGRDGEAPADLTPELCEQILQQHLDSNSMLAIFPIQDWLACDEKTVYGGDPLDERINIPANPRHYWRYRSHITLESMLSDAAFNEKIAKMVKKSGRGA